MRSNWWLSALTGLEMVTLAGVLCLMVRQRMLARWPSLFTALSLELCANLALISFLGRRGYYAAYFYIYWGSSGILALLRFWVIADILRSFPGIRVMPRKLYLFVGISGATMLAASALTCPQHGISTARAVLNTSVALNHSITIAWGTFAAVFLAAIKFRDLGWSRTGAAVAIGISLRVIGSMIVAEMLLSHSAQTRLIANGLDSTCSIAIFCFWVYSLVAPPPNCEPEEDSPDTQRVLQALLALASSREG